jgi:hypothetical protein
MRRQDAEANHDDAVGPKGPEAASDPICFFWRPIEIKSDSGCTSMLLVHAAPE